MRRVATWLSDNVVPIATLIMLVILGFQMLGAYVTGVTWRAADFHRNVEPKEPKSYRFSFNPDGSVNTEEGPIPSTHADAVKR